MNQACQAGYLMALRYDRNLSVVLLYIWMDYFVHITQVSSIAS